MSRISSIKCRVCKIKLTNDNWSLSYQKYQSNICKKCDDKRSKLYYETHKNKTQQYQKQYYLKNKEKIDRYGREYNLILKLEVFKYYSNNIMQCNCCGENHIEFLQLDHINCGAKHHNKDKRPNQLGGLALYRWIINNNFPNGYQVLCANCNFAKGAFGMCPHKKEVIK